MKPMLLCAYCRKPHGKSVSAINRAVSIGAPLYCDMKCAGKARRSPFKPKAQRVAEKRAYDAERRVLLRDRLKAEKAAYHKRTYDPVKAAKLRKKTMPRHVEYCRQPEYKKWKREYDRQYRAKEYGAFGEAYLLTIDLNREIKQRESNYEIRRQNQTGNKRQARRRAEAPDRHRASQAES